MIDIRILKLKLSFLGKPIYVFFITLLSFVLLCFLFFKNFIDFQQDVKPISIKDIKSVKIINLETSKDRKARYEEMITKQFGNKMFGIEINDLTMRATHGKYDLIFEELNEINEVVKKIPAIDIQENREKLKKNVRYKIYDKNDSDYYWYYKNSPEKQIWQHRDMKIGELGCITSHLRAIYELANSDNDYGLILEDDLLLDKEFSKKLSQMLKNAPKKFGMLKLDGVHNGKSGRWNAWFRSRLRYGYNPDFYNANCDKRKVGMTTASVVSRDFARKLVHFILSHDINGADGTADVFYYMVLPRVYGFKNIYIGKNWIVKQRGEFTHKSSTIGKIN